MQIHVTVHDEDGPISRHSDCRMRYESDVRHFALSFHFSGLRHGQSVDQHRFRILNAPAWGSIGRWARVWHGILSGFMPLFPDEISVNNHGRMVLTPQGPWEVWYSLRAKDDEARDLFRKIKASLP